MVKYPASVTTLMMAQMHQLKGFASCLLAVLVIRRGSRVKFHVLQLPSAENKCPLGLLALCTPHADVKDIIMRTGCQANRAWVQPASWSGQENQVACLVEREGKVMAGEKQLWWPTYFLSVATKWNKICKLFQQCLADMSKQLDKLF